jgi:hypothetical protein
MVDWFGICPQLRYVTSTIWHWVLVAQGTRHTPRTQSEPGWQGCVASQKGRGRVSGTHAPSLLQYSSGELQVMPAPQAA